MRKLFEPEPYRTPDSMLGKPPVPLYDPTPNLLATFDATLESACKERSEAPMQRLFEEHPIFLVYQVSPHKTFCFHRVPVQDDLGGGKEIDFLLCDWTSIGPQWTIVELESPTKSAINSRGISGDLRTAQQQIGDYRRALKLPNSRGFYDFPRVHSLRRSLIVIGTQILLTSQEDQDRLAELRDDYIEVASYDRLRNTFVQLSEMWRRLQSEHNTGQPD